MDPETLKPHPRNYAHHPQEQLEHIAASIRQHGFYRNVVVAKDGTILAGHGTVEAAKLVGLAEIPIVRLKISPDDPQALKLLAGDNSIAHLAEVDDRAFTEILREVHDIDIDALLGTGYDEAMLANLVMVTRPQSEIEDIDAAAEWLGLPEFEPPDGIQRRITLLVHFKDTEDRAEFFKRCELGDKSDVKYIWWPLRKSDDLKSVILDG